MVRTIEIIDLCGVKRTRANPLGHSRSSEWKIDEEELQKRKRIKMDRKDRMFSKFATLNRMFNQEEPKHVYNYTKSQFEVNLHKDFKPNWYVRANYDDLLLFRKLNRMETKVFLWKIIKIYCRAKIEAFVYRHIVEKYVKKRDMMKICRKNNVPLDLQLVIFEFAGLDV